LYLPESATRCRGLPDGLELFLPPSYSALSGFSVKRFCKSFLPIKRFAKPFYKIFCAFRIFSKTILQIVFADKTVCKTVLQKAQIMPVGSIVLIPFNPYYPMSPNLYYTSRTASLHFATFSMFCKKSKRKILLFKKKSLPVRTEN